VPDCTTQGAGKVAPALYSGGSNPIYRRTWMDRLKKDMAKIDISSFNSTSGSLEDYVDLMSKMLELDPDVRISASDALKHKFFNFYRKYINAMHEYMPTNLKSTSNS
jgi:serine/threonine protein kinase